MTPSIANSYAVAARAALAVCLSLTAFVFVLGMPWNDLGLWRQVEVPAAAIHAMSAFCIVALAILVAVRDETTIGILRNPVTLLLFALPLFTMAVAPFSDSPWRSIHGTLKHEVGALFYFELAIMTLGSAVVLRSKLAAILEGALAVSMLAIIGLYALPENSATGLPMTFPEWVGLLAAAVAFVLVSQSGKIVSFRSLVALVILVSGIYVASNRTVVLSVAAAAAVLALFRFPVACDLLKRPRIRAASVVVAGLIGLVVMANLAPVLEAQALKQPVYEDSAEVLSRNPLDRHIMQNGALGTLWSRSQMVRLVLRDFAEHPQYLLAGHGWGAFATAYNYHSREVPGRHFPTELSTASRTYMDSQKKADFHSHDLPIEALLSGGVIAFVLWFATVGKLAAQGRRGMLVATGVMVSSLFWFPTNHMIVGMAALLACGIAPVQVSEKTRNRLGKIVAVPAALACLFLLASGAVVFGVARVEHDERYFLPLAAAEHDTKTCGTIGTLMLPEDEVNISLYDVLSQRIAASKVPAKEIYDKTTNVMTLSCTLRSYYEGGHDINALVSSLEKRAMFVGIGPASYGPMVDDIVNWGKDVDLLLSMAPERTEHVVPYLTALMQRSKNKDLVGKEIDRYAAKLKHDDPIYEYVLALKARLAGDETGFTTHMKASVALGYANILAITPDQAKEMGLL